MAAIRNDENIPYNQLSQEEQDLPHCCFLEHARYEVLEAEVERLEEHPIPFDTLQHHFIGTFPLYAALYARKRGMRDPFCTEGFRPILAAARARPDSTLPFFIILIVLACLKAPPNDQLPLDPAAQGPTSVKVRRCAAIMRNLFQMLVATIEVLCPCGGEAREARSERRGIGPQSQPNEPVYKVSRLFTRAAVACLKYDNVEIDHAYAEGAWAATMTKVKTQREAIDLETLPKRSPILNCDVYSDFHPRAILRNLLPFPRSIHLCLTALAYSDQLAKKPHLPQIPLRRIYDALVYVNQDDQYPIGGFDWLMNEIGKTENDPIQEIVRGLLDARAEYERNGGLYITVNGGFACGESSIDARFTIKYQSLLLYESGQDPSSLDIQEVASISGDRQNRIELVRRYNVPQSDVDKLTPVEACSQLWLRREKLYLESKNVDIFGLKDNEINSLLHETVARYQLKENGYLNVDNMSRKEVNKAVDLLRVTISLENAGFNTTGMSEKEIRSTRWSQTTGRPQVESLIALLDDEDVLVPPIPSPTSSDSKRLPADSIDPTLPLSSFVNQSNANQFYTTIAHGNFRKDNNSPFDYGDLLAAFLGSNIFRLCQYAPNDLSDGSNNRTRGTKTYGAIIDRSIIRRWMGKKETLGWIKTSVKNDVTEKGANRIIMRKWRGWKGTLKAHKVKIVLSEDTPEDLRPQLLAGIASSPWIQKGMRCGKVDYERENVAELKWFALLFASTMWDLVSSEEEDSEMEGDDDDLEEGLDENLGVESEQEGSGGADSLKSRLRPRKAKEGSAAGGGEDEDEEQDDDREKTEEESEYDGSAEEGGRDECEED